MNVNNFTTLVLGASGATGKELVNQLILMGQNVKVIVRRNAQIPDIWENNKYISIIRSNISEIEVVEMADYIKDCQCVVSCLGHNMSIKGIFGKPRKLVVNAVELICSAIEKQTLNKPCKFILMNTTGNRNLDLKEVISLGETLVIGLVRFLIPPHLDNENAANYLRLKIGQSNKKIQWVVVRPDSLVNDLKVTEYQVFASPTRSPIFNSGTTSRINAGNFMARLVVEKELWEEWKGKMPVIYNK